MNLWPVEHFFPQSGVPVYVRYPKLRKKCSTGQRIIGKEVTSYKIHTLVYQKIVIWVYDEMISYIL